LVQGQDGLVHAVHQGKAVEVTGGAPGRLLPVLGDVGVEQLPPLVRPVGGELVAVVGVARCAGIGAAVDGGVEVDGNSGHAWLPVLGGGVLRVQLVAGHVIADRADDAAVAGVDPVGAGRVVGVDTPVERPAETDDVERADV